MSTVYRDAIVVTGTDDDERSDVRTANWLAKELGLQVTDVVYDNGIYSSFMICPDGWKEGSKGSETCDLWRAEWKAEVKRQKLLIDWVHVRYGGDYLSDGGSRTADVVDASE